MQRCDAKLTVDTVLSALYKQMPCWQRCSSSSFWLLGPGVTEDWAFCLSVLEQQALADAN